MGGLSGSDTILGGLIARDILKYGSFATGETLQCQRFLTQPHITKHTVSSFLRCFDVIEVRGLYVGVCPSLISKYFSATIVSTQVL
jgi:hypothetical protein